jgi:hypothetical protein
MIFNFKLLKAYKKQAKAALIQSKLVKAKVALALKLEANFICWTLNNLIYIYIFATKSRYLD